MAEWTPTPPTEPGWYFLHHPSYGGLLVVQAVYSVGLWIGLYIGGWSFLDAPPEGGQWLRIETPEVPNG